MKIERLDTQLAFRATKTELDRVRLLAQQQDRSIAQMIRRIFRRGLALEKAQRAS